MVAYMQSCGNDGSMRHARCHLGVTGIFVCPMFLFVSWAQGFLSGMNAADYITTKRKLALLPDAGSITAYIDKYCQDNSSKRAVSGLLQIYLNLRPNELH